jgi:polysaccharide biosynthesis protein PslL
MTNRNTTIDVAKGIGIILVVFGHNWIVLHDKGEIFRIIFSFHVPLFFFLSGIFLKESSELRPFLWSRAETLLKPYFVILTALGTLQLLLAIIKRTVDIRNSQFLLGIIYGSGKTISWAPLWFLPHLFIALTFSLIIIKISRNKSWLTFISILFLIIGIHFITTFWHLNPASNSFIEINHLPGLPWSIDLLPITSAFIIFGYLLRDWAQKIVFNKIGCLISIVIFGGLHYYFNETIDLNYRIYTSAVVSTIQAGIGIYLTINLASLIQKYSIFRKLLAYLGSGTLFILIFHDTIQINVFELLSKVINIPYINAGFSLLAGILIPMILWESTKRLKPISLLLLPSNKSRK